MKRKFWSVRAAADAPDVGELSIYGLIGADGGMGWLFDEITPKQFKEDLDGLGAISELRVFINSEGGDVFAGQTIHSMLKRHAAKKTVYVDGLAASIASVIAMAGDSTIMPRNAMMMVHNPHGLSIGDADDHRHFAGVLDRVRESIIAAYQGKTGMEREELVSLLDAETWMTADEAVERGFADEVEEAREIAASVVAPGRFVVNGQELDVSQYLKVPAPAAMFGGTPRIGIRSDSYIQQAESAVRAVRELARRTSERRASRERVGRSLSAADESRIRALAEELSGLGTNMKALLSGHGLCDAAVEAAYAAFVHSSMR